MVFAVTVLFFHNDQIVVVVKEIQVSLYAKAQARMAFLPLMKRVQYIHCKKKSAMHTKSVFIATILSQ